MSKTIFFSRSNCFKSREQHLFFIRVWPVNINPLPLSPTQRRIILKMQNITKRFPGVVALDDVSFDVHEGEVHCLMGENGAGKSTLMKIMNGIYTEYEGQILLDGQLIHLHSTKD